MNAVMTAPTSERAGKHALLRGVFALVVIASLLAWGLAVAKPAVAQDVFCAGQLATLPGTTGDDLLLGTPGNDVIAGLGGNDRIAGGGGDDLICGGPGNDELRGNQGADEVHGGPGADVVLGGVGPDALFGEDGDDQLHGGLGGDDIRGGLGNDELSGDEGDDTLRGGPGDDWLVGGEGSLSGVDELLGEAGSDALVTLDREPGDVLRDRDAGTACVVDSGDRFPRVCVQKLSQELANRYLSLTDSDDTLKSEVQSEPDTTVREFGQTFFEQFHGNKAASWRQSREP